MSYFVAVFCVFAITTHTISQDCVINGWQATTVFLVGHMHKQIDPKIITFHIWSIYTYLAIELHRHVHSWQTLSAVKACCVLCCVSVCVNAVRCPWRWHGPSHNALAWAGGSPAGSSRGWWAPTVTFGPVSPMFLHTRILNNVCRELKGDVTLNLSDTVEYFNSRVVHNLDVLLDLVDERPRDTPLITLCNHQSCMDDPHLWGRPSLHTWCCRYTRL